MSTVVWKVLAEIILALILVTSGSAFWAIIKSPSHLRRTLGDHKELDNYFEFYGYAKILEESRQIKPMAETYAQNIALLERAHFGALYQTRNVLLILVLIIIAASWLLGPRYVVANLAIFILPVAFEMPGSAKNYNFSHVYTVAVNLAKWNTEDRRACFDYCTRTVPVFEDVYFLIDRMQYPV